MFNYYDVKEQTAIVNSEQIVLGSFLIDGDRQLLKSTSLKIEHFWLDEHKKLFKIILNADAKGEKFDVASIYDDYIQDGKLDFIGGYDGLIKLVDAIDTLTTFEVHESRVIKGFQRRQAIDYLGKYRESELSLENLIANLNTLNTIISNELPDLNEAIDRTISNMLESQQGMLTKYSEFDRLTKGLHAGELVIIGARPSMGKSAFVANLINNMTKNDTNPDGCVSGLFSFEMNDESVIQRMSSMNGGVPLIKYRDAVESFDKKDWHKNNMAMQYLRGFDLVVVDKEALTINEIRKYGQAMRNKYGKDRQLLIVIDYLQLIKPRNENSPRNEQVSEISRELKIMARSLNCCVVALVQLNRGVEQRDDKRPRMSDIRDSGSIEQDADLIGFLYRDEYYNKDSDNGNIIELNITKHRNGPLGTIQLYFDKEVTKIINLELRKE